ncbi:MAG: hypothetical protein AB7I25_06490 [Vicinamibacterales bacterium]
MRCAICCLVLALAGPAGPLGAQVLDRVLARVDGQAILLSDVRLARAIGLGGVRADDGDEAALRRLVERQLMLAEVLRSQPSQPDPAAVARATAGFVTRAGGPEAAAAALRAAGVPEAYLAQLARETTAVDAYLRQRFGADVAAPARATWARDLRRRSRVECVLPGC